MASSDAFLPPNDTGYESLRPSRPPDDSSTPSSSSSWPSGASRRRVDMRWARVTPAQLEDDEFLLKQVRRLEIASSARRSTQRDGTKVSGSNWDDLDQDHLIRERIANAKAKAARGAGADQDNEDGEGKKDDNRSGVRFSVLKTDDEQQERDVVNALCLLADLSSESRAVLMQQRLKTALRQQCAFPNPLYRLIAIRRKIMRHIQAAVAVQHQQRVAYLLQWTEAVDTIRKASLAPTSRSAAEAFPTVASPLVHMEKPTIAETNSSACEGSVGLQILSCVLDCLRDPSASAVPQKKFFLHEIFQLLSSMPALAFAQCGGEDASSALPRKMSTQQLNEITTVADSIHEFLVDNCPKPSTRPSVPVSPKVHAVGTLNGELDLDDRTNAVSALLHLAGLTGSVRDFLVVIKVLLGVPDRTLSVNHQLCACSTSSRALSAPTPVSPVATDSPTDEGSHPSTTYDVVTTDTSSKFHVAKKKSEGSINHLDFRDSDESTNLSVAESENVSPTYLRKAGVKVFGIKASVASPMPSGSKINSARSNPLRPSSSIAKSRQRDECIVDTFQTSSLNINLDSSSTRRDPASRSTPLVTPRVETPPLTARCPRLKSLRTGSVVAQLQNAKALSHQLVKGRSSSNGRWCNSHELGIQDISDEGDEREVWSCGQNSYGELGHGDTIPRKSFERIESLQGKDIALLGAGNEHTIALTSDGRVYTCGYNDNGQCGQGGNARVSHMTELPKIGEGTVTQVHAYNGCEHSIFVMSNGRVATCGYNYRGQLGHGNTTSESVPKLIRGLEGRIVRLVSCSYYHTIMTCEDISGGGGHVLTFGRNDYGQLGHNDAIDRKVPQEVSLLSDHHIISVACGQYHSMAVTSTGKVFGFGKNDYGQLGIDSTENQLIPIQVRGSLEKQTTLEVRCGYYHTVVLCGGAHLFGFGRNDYGQLGLGKAAASAVSNFQLQQQRFSQPHLIEDLEGKEIVRFACGCYHTVAVSDSGMLYVFGRNNHGQLGTGDTNERLYPFPIDDFLGKRVAFIAAGFYHTVLLTGGKDEDRDDQDQDKEKSDETPTRDAIRCKPHEVSSEDLLSSPILLDVVKNDNWLQRIRPDSKEEFRHGNDYREEDDPNGTDCLSGLSPESSMSQSRLGSSIARSHGSSESAIIATLIIAHLDRLSRGFVQYHESLRVPCVSNVKNSVVNILSSDSAPTSVFPGTFSPYIIDLRSSTFEVLCALITHLNDRKVDGLSHLSHELFSPIVIFGTEQEPNTGESSRQLRANSMLQQYLLLVCVRLLRANLLQLLRSGISNALLAVMEAISTSRVEEGSQKLDISSGELSRMLSVLGVVRNTLLSIIDSKQKAHSIVSEDVAKEAVITFVEAIELLMPCSCLQVQLYQHVLSDTNSDCFTINCYCKENCQNGHRCVGVRLPKSKEAFNNYLLRRLSDDLYVLKFLPLGSTITAARQPSTEKYVNDLSLITGIYESLLGFVAEDFHQSFSGLLRHKAGNQQAVASALGAIHTIQKHIVCWASETTHWERSDTDKLRPESSTLSMNEQVSTLIDDIFRLDKSHLASVPVSWRAMIEFSLMVTSTCCRVLLQANSSPSIANKSAVLELVGRSIVGQLMPPLTAALYEFTNQPLFVVALLPNIKGFLKIIDSFNMHFLAMNEIEKSFIDSITAMHFGVNASRSKAGTGVFEKDHSYDAKLGTARLAKPVAAEPAQVVSVSNALNLQWSYRLEKELAVLASEMAVTLVIGDPVSPIQTGIPESRQWTCNPLFSGGINLALLVKSIQTDKTGPDTISRRVVRHTPFSTAAKYLPPSIGGEFAPFALILPSISAVESDSAALNAVGTSSGLIDARKYRRIFSHGNVRKFLMSFASDSDISDDWSTCGDKLCEWIRERYVRSDASYRMLIQLASKQKQTSGAADPRENQIRLNDIRIEKAAFAALIHHSALSLQAFHFALYRLYSEKSTAQTSPPSSFLALWRYVADIRRLVASMKTFIRNEQPSQSTTDDKLGQILAHQDQYIKRLELLLLVDVYDEEEHANQERDSGFICPQNPAFIVSAYNDMIFSPSRSTSEKNQHLHARYTYSRLPFLAAFPSSKWRIVRIVVHTISRWKALLYIDKKVEVESSLAIVSKRIVQFISTSDSMPSPNAIKAFLIDPCRRRSFSTRGFEILWEMLSTISSDSIQADVAHQVTQALVLRSKNGPALLSPDLISLQNAGVYYTAIYNNALSDFLMQLTELIADKADATIESQDNNRFWVLAELIASWGMNFGADQFEFVGDIGILPLLHQLLQTLPGAELIESEKTRLLSSATRSNSTLALIDYSARSSPRSGAMVSSKPHSNLYRTLWTIFQSVCATFARPIQKNETPLSFLATTMLATTPSVVSRPLEVVYAEALRTAKLVIPGWDLKSDSISNPPEGQSNSSTSSGVRRSFDVIDSITRVSPIHRRVTCTYQGMMTPPAGKAAMTPLLKANEFSITTWIYTQSPNEDTLEGALTTEQMDRQLVFVRGNEDELNPYLMLVPESPTTWQVEVGFVLHFPNSNSDNSQTRSRKFDNILSERLVSKEPIPSNKWIHIAIIVEGSKVRLYINGILDSQRAVTSQFAAVWATRSVDLPLQFGRLAADGVLNQKDSTRSSLELLQYSLTNTNQSGFRTTNNSGLLEFSCFDGWINQCRFHNRALSPIHVRVVFDELKSSSNVGTGITGRTGALATTERTPVLLPSQYVRLVDLFALLVQLGSSPEGIMHFRAHFSPWMLLLWRTFLVSDSWQLQQSTLRVLRKLLPLVSPITATEVLFSVSSEGGIKYLHRDFGFIQQVIRVIGAGIAVFPMETASENNGSAPETVPWTLLFPNGIHSGLLSPEPVSESGMGGILPANIIQLEEVRAQRNITIVNELVELLQHLYMHTTDNQNPSWKHAIECTVGTLLDKPSSSFEQRNLAFRNSVISHELISQVDKIGSLYFLGGAVESSLRPGITAQLKVTRDPVHVISHGTSSSLARVSDVPTVVTLTKVVSQGYPNSATTRALNKSNLSPIEQSETCTGLPEYVSVRWDELSPSKQFSAIAAVSSSQGSSNTIRPAGVHLHHQLLKQAQRMLPGILESLVELHSWPTLTFRDSSSPVESKQERLPKLERSIEAMQTGNLLLKCLAQCIHIDSTASEIKTSTELVETIFQIASNDDGGVEFETLAQVERKTFRLRQRIYSILIDLGVQGSQDLADLFSIALDAKSGVTTPCCDTHLPETKIQNLEVSITESTRTAKWSVDKGMTDPQQCANYREVSDHSGEEDAEEEEMEVEEETGGDSDNELGHLDEDDDEDGDGGEDSEAEENRAEFVEELMLMGFPEEWCILALKQTENDIVSASAWIVDNLDYLSKLQLSLEKKQLDLDVTRINNDEDDDEIQDAAVDGLYSTFQIHDTLYPDPVSSLKPTNVIHSESDYPMMEETSRVSGEYNTETLSSAVGDEHSPNHNLCNHSGTESRIDYEEVFLPLPLSEKEMGRKVFGETYYPFEEGGYLSNMEMDFLSVWKPNQLESDSMPSPNPGLNGSTSQQKRQTDSGFVDIEFDKEIRKLDLAGLIKMLRFLERQLAVLYCRFLAVSIIRYEQQAQMTEGLIDIPLSCQDILNLTRFVLYRGDQLSEYAHVAEFNYLSTKKILAHTILGMLREDYETVFLKLSDFIVDQLEAAAKNKQFEAYLWTQREIQRADKQVLTEPAVEISIWLVEIVFSEAKLHANTSFSSLHKSSIACRVLRRLRYCLAATNLPLKCFVLHTITRILVVLYRSGCSNENLSFLLNSSKLSVREIVTAAKQRLSRETAQDRLLYSPYMQAYVELLHVMRLVTRGTGVQANDAASEYTPAVSFDLGTIFQSTGDKIASVPDQCWEDNPTEYIFDRTRSRTSLLTYSEDGTSVSYTGNDSWKAACAEQGLTTGQHAWSIRIDKSSSSYIFVGVGTRRLNVNSFLGADDQSWGFIGDKALYYQRNRVRTFSDGFGEGDTIGVHLDCERGTLAFTKNGESLGIAFDNVVGEVYPAVALYSRHQRVTLVGDTLFSGDLTNPGSSSPLPSLPLWAHDTESLKGDIDDCLIACELMNCMIEHQSIRHELLRDAHQIASHWLSGTTQFVETRAGWSLWVDKRPSTCEPFGFLAGERVRTARGHGVVAGVAYGRIWVHVEGEDGAWYFHPSRLRVSTLTVASDLKSPDYSRGTDTNGPADSKITTCRSNPNLSLSLDEFIVFSQHKKWSGIVADRQLIKIVDEYCESTRTSPWNLSPEALIELVLDRQSRHPGFFDGFAVSRDEFSNDVSTIILVARFALLRYFNLVMRRALPFFDLTWKYYACYGVYQPCQLLSACRGSVFVCLKNSLFTALMQRTANSPRKAEDEYDYPDDLPHLQVNRLKAAAAKCHPGTTKSLFLSLFGQAFEVLHFLPLRTLRMVYSHPMDDGQLRSFKVKFEGEGADDYGGPYREFFSQFFAELQALEPSGDVAGENNNNNTNMQKEPPVKCLLPFLLPSPNWRNGVGDSREKFVINGSIVSAMPREPDSRTSLLAESAEEKYQLYKEMFVFLGQMLGICLRTGVCVRLDLATSTWKQLTAEDDAVSEFTGGLWDESIESALSSLKETDYVAFSLWKSLRAIFEENVKCRKLSKSCNHLEEQLVAMDLDFTTTLSDGRSVELLPGGCSISVTLDNLELYLRRMLRARVHEAHEAIMLLKRGLNSILPVSALAVLTWTDLETRMCGVDEIDVSLLRANTEYDEDVSPTDEFVQRFWRVLEGMETPDRRAFLRFVWARSRLPMGAAQFHQKFKIQSLAPGNGDGSSVSTSAASSTSTTAAMDAQLPKSHTCFFALQLPRYSSDEVCRRQLLYAIHNCVEMDGDFRLADTEMSGWTDVSAADQLRL